MRGETLCEAFQQTVARVPDRVALRAPGGGAALTYREYGERVRRVAAGLHAAGLRRGDTLALMMGNRPEFHLLDTAAMHLGAVPFSLYATSSPDQVAHLVADAGARLAVVERRFADRVGAEVVLDVDELGALEARGEGADLDFGAAWRAVRPQDLLTLIYTSGTTGPPKGVEVTHANQLATAHGYDDMVHFPEGADVVSYLPMAHIAERNCSHYWGLVFGFTITICADPATLFDALRDTRPAWFFGVPRIFEKLRAQIESGADAALRAAIAGGDPGAPELEAVRAQIGLERVKAMLIGGTAVPTDLIRFYHALGLPLGEIWGMSETTGIGTFNREGRERPGTVGAPAPGVELRLAGAPTDAGEAGDPLVGEVEVRGACVSPGYRGQPEATAASRTPDGWLRTGDLGTLDEDGFLSIVDRKKELIISSAGKNMSPSNIESEIKAATPLVGSVVVVGDARPYNVALLVLDFESAAAFARERGIGERDVADLGTEPVVLEAVERAVARANERLSRPEQVKRFRLLATEWPPGGDELTPTMKLRRKPIAAKYAAEIEALYD